MTCKKKDFYGSLKDPYYNRPIILKSGTAIGTILQLCIRKGKQSETTTFIKIGDNSWQRIDEKNLSSILDERELELHLIECWKKAQAGKTECFISDMMNCVELKRPWEGILHDRYGF